MSISGCVHEATRPLENCPACNHPNTYFWLKESNDLSIKQFNNSAVKQS